LLSTIFVPKSGKVVRHLSYEQLSTQIEKKFGGFRGLQVDRLTEFLLHCDHYEWDASYVSKVSQTPAGISVACKWLSRMYGFAPPFPAVAETLFEGERVKQAASTSLIRDKADTTQLDPPAEKRTAEWVESTGDESLVTPETSTDIVQTEESALAYHMNDLDAQYAFFLVVSKLEASEDLQALANVPWLQVYDFDSNSRLNGLLSKTENVISDCRNLTLSTIGEAPKAISEKATHWVFMKGLHEKAETVFEGKALNWYRENKVHVQQHCTALSKFCSFYKQALVLVLWYDNDKEATRCLEWLMIQLDQAFPDQSHKFLGKVIICTSSSSEDNDVLRQITERFEWENTKIKISTENVCNFITHYKTVSNAVELHPSFPKHCDDNTLERVSTSRQNYAWLTDSLDALATFSEHSALHSQDVMKEFVKGGVLAWDETCMNEIAVERSCQEAVCRHIKSHYIQLCKSAIIRIYHAPGGGGTTFGRQILWKLRNDAPCVATTTNSISISGLVERIDFLHNLTMLPVIVLIDGISDYEVEMLHANTNGAVIIHVQRFSKELANSYYEPESCCYLAGNVTVKESKGLAELFSKFSPGNKTTLSKLHKEVANMKQSTAHQVFEYGLAAFNHEFKGVIKYVRGYMEPRTALLQNWQKAVAYLSLLMFYGQCGIPCFVFAKLLKSGEEQLELLEALHNGRQFITSARGYWKINYNAVAKEILEFALTVQGGVEDDSAAGNRLSKQAQKNLHCLVENFVQYIGEATGGDSPERISRPLKEMIIKRDYDDTEMADIGRKKKYSRLLDDIRGKENRINVLKQFTETFPNNPEFRAHLGRLYGLYGRFQDAEDAFQMALDLRIKERSDHDTDKPDNVRGRFHHMFGFSYLQKVTQECKIRNLPHALHGAKKAVEQFTQGRKYAVKNRSYGYIGEVRARLLIVELYHKMFNMPDAFCTKKQSSKHVELREFVRVSHSECDRLLAECQQYTTSTDLMKIDHYFDCVSSYNYHFQGIGELIPEPSPTSPNMPLARSKIASIKMKYYKQNEKEIKYLDAIKEQDDIDQVVCLLESTLRAVFLKRYKLATISGDMLEWLDAIRHPLTPDTYALEEVLELVQQWHQRNEFGFALFYLYVLNFLMAACSSESPERHSFLEKTLDLSKRLRTVSYQHSIRHRCRELLAAHSKFTIRKLLPSRCVGTWDREEKQWTNKKSAEKLQVCTGTVKKSDLPLTGFIQLDVPNPSRNHSVLVFFVPIRHDLHGRRFSEKRTRVEFFIMFNTNNGAEAEGVTKLEKRTCRNCSLTTEVITLNQPNCGICSRCGKRHNLM